MKKLKIIVSALAVVILAVGGYVVYELKFKNYEVADPKVDSIVEEEFEIELEDGTKFIIKDGNVETVASSGASSPTEQNENNQSDSNTNSEDTDTNGENTDTSGSDGANQSANNNTTNNGSNSNNGNNSTTDRVTVATIKNKYNTAFNLLEKQTRSRLNSLISEAKAEYTAKKNNGEKISYGYFYRKYMGAATALEQSTSSAVNSVVKLVELDLKANGFNAEHAQSYVQNYEKTKESLRNDLMKKVLDY